MMDAPAREMTGPQAAHFHVLQAEAVPDSSDLLRLSKSLLSESEHIPRLLDYPQSRGDRNRVLEMILEQEPLPELFAHLSAWFERQLPEHTCSFLYRNNGQHQTDGGVNLAALNPQLASELQRSLEDGERTSWERLEEYGACGPWVSCAVGEIPSSIAEPWGAAVILRKTGHPQQEYQSALTELCRTAAVVLDHRHLYELLVRQANFDMLTGLPNRFLFEERLDAMLADARKKTGAIAVLWIDLDRFQELNDLLGHRTGDDVIRQAAQRLGHKLPPQAILARLGGDEFAVALLQGLGAAKVETVAEELLASLRRPFRIGGQELSLTASLGYSLFPEHGTDSATLTRNADTALHHVKRCGRNHARPYAPALNVNIQERVDLESHLQRAVERNELKLVYQPQLSPSGDLKGFEALLRWMHPKRGVVPPAEFIPLAEELGMIVPMGRWALREACRQMAEWRSEGCTIPRVAVNVSAIQLYWDEFAETVRETLSEFDLEPERLELELTESAVLHNIDEAVSQMKRLRSLGVPLSIDDFGVGYSSLSYLQRLPVESLKIDKSFTDGLDAGPVSGALVHSIIVLGHNLGLSVVAEGVETLAQWRQLADYGCDLMQGYLLGKPMAPEKARTLLSPSVRYAKAALSSR